MHDPGGHNASPEELIGERISGRFVVERLIGTGPLSSSFRAHDERLHRRVTVKLFHPRHRDDAAVVTAQVAAARSVARLSHENLGMVIDSSEHDGLPVVVLEHVRGENLDERSERYAPLGIGEVASYGLQIARALSYAHGHGVVHGNLRPRNILLTEDRSVKLVDFGGGSYVSQLVGDPFLAPELSEIEPDAGHEPSDDIYALGAVLLNALTEQQPETGVSANQIQIVRPDIERAFAEIISRCLALDPAARPASMREVAAVMQGLQERPLHTGIGVGTQSESTQPMRAVGEVVEDEKPLERRRMRSHTRKPRVSHQRRARFLAWSMVLAPLVALFIVAAMIAGERAEQQTVNEKKGASGPIEQVDIASAESFDPDGDGTEHPDDVPNAFDNDLETSWQTEGYDTARFANLKEGIGLILTLPTPLDVRDVAIFTKLPGWDVQIFAAGSPQSEISGWEPVSAVTSVRDGELIPVDVSELELVGMPPARTQHLLLWITRLSIDTNDLSAHRARISEVRVLAALDEGN